MQERLAAITEREFHTGLGTYLVVASGVVIPILMYIPAGYGRHLEADTVKRFFKGCNSVSIDHKIAWVLMEFPAVAVSLACLRNRTQNSTPALVLSGMYLWHYVYRSLIYPLTVRSANQTPLHIVMSAAHVTSSVSYLITREVTHFKEYPESWMQKPAFKAGVVLFALGWIMNLHSDFILRNLRKPGETGYKIPRGGLFRFVTAANYFAEFAEWCGLALAAQAPSTYVFVFLTFANLFPRAVQHHRWYKQKFEDYPKERKAFFPFVY
ncbi:Steroid 5-alpha-reductase DET2 [Diplonema papillatum]|nr:Steroid 5-alpha-reductase DET2 [Diplonema papillatum]